jgi:hypothetical protein
VVVYQLLVDLLGGQVVKEAEELVLVVELQELQGRLIVVVVVVVVLGVLLRVVMQVAQVLSS